MFTVYSQTRHLTRLLSDLVFIAALQAWPDLTVVVVQTSRELAAPGQSHAAIWYIIISIVCLESCVYVYTTCVYHVQLQAKTSQASVVAIMRRGCNAYWRPIGGPPDDWGQGAG